MLALLAAGLSACGSAAVTAKPADIAYGRTGGNIRPERLTLVDGGLKPAAVLALDKKVRAVWSGLQSRQCPETLPDIATEYIRFEGRTVRVHGACEPIFTRLWNALSASRS